MSQTYCVATSQGFSEFGGKKKKNNQNKYNRSFHTGKVERPNNQKKYNKVFSFENEKDLN